MYLKATEDDSNIVFAIIKSNSSHSTFRDKVIERTALAVKEEWMYDKVSIEDSNFQDDFITLTFDCITEDGDEEIRAIDLTKTFLYK